jgi:hypothetical protein
MNPLLADRFVLHSDGTIERVIPKLYKKNMKEEFRYVLMTQLEGYEISENSLFSSQYQDDWHFNTDLYRKHFDKRYEDKLCICGHKIQELCHIYFKKIEWSFQVGNCCIKKNLDFLWIKYTDARKELTKEYKSIHDVISSLLKDVVKKSVIYTYCKMCDKICHKRYENMIQSCCISCIKVHNPIEYFLHTHKVKQYKKEEEYIALMTLKYNNFMTLDKIRIEQEKQRRIEEEQKEQEKVKLEIQQRRIEQEILRKKELENIEREQIRLKEQRKKELEIIEREQQRIKEEKERLEREQIRLKEEQRKKELEIIEREQQRIKEEKERLEREKNRVLKEQKNRESMQRKKNECLRCKKNQIEKKLCGPCKKQICEDCTKRHYLLWECRRQEFEFCVQCKV